MEELSKASVKNILLAILLLVSLDSFSQIKGLRQVSFLQLQESMNVHPKPVVIKIHTERCAYCRLQDKQIEKSRRVLDKLNNDYYCVNLNAEATSPITFSGKTYYFKNYSFRSGIHQLVLDLMGDEKIAYPALIVLDKEYKIVKRYTGYLKKELLEGIF